jgi:serine/threonine-protein kinase RsbW
VIADGGRTGAHPSHREGRPPKLRKTEPKVHSDHDQRNDGQTPAPGAVAAVRLEMESRPESITVVRSILAGLGEHLQLDAELLDDLRTAVSEACNNVVLHAYGERSGPLQVEVELTPEALHVAVRDWGSGIQRLSAGEDRMGVGLAVISALAASAEFRSEPGEGTEVRMTFGTAPGAHDRDPLLSTPLGLGAAAVELGGDVVVSVAPATLLPHLLGRAVRAVAAGSHFAVDRFAHLHRLTSLVGDPAVMRVGSGASDGVAVFSIVSAPRRIELRVGPVPAQAAGELVGSGAGTFAPLIERAGTSTSAGTSVLELVIVEPRA